MNKLNPCLDIWKEVKIRCHICDVVLHENEIKWNPVLKEWEICGLCLDIAEETFEPLSEEEISEQIQPDDEGVEESP